jgi:hypothetical protein
MQEADVQRGDGLIEVDEPLRVRVVQDVFGVPDVLQQERCAAVIGNKRLGMDRYDGVIVNVDNPRVGMGALGYLVDIVLCGQAGPNVDELPDTVVMRKGAQHSHEIIAVVDGQPTGPRYQLVQFHARYAVGLKVVVAAEIVVVHAGHVRFARVDSRQLFNPVQPVSFSCVGVVQCQHKHS